MKRITTSLSLLSVISLMGLVSCVKQAPVFEEPRALVDIESVTMTAHNFILEDGGTKTAITLGSDGLNFSWSSNDVVGVFPNNGKGTQVKFPISDGEVEGGSSTSNANFTGNGWAVMKAENYSSYYPFVPDMDLDMKAIPVSYAGQVQVGSGTTGHLNGYDYMLTTPTEPSANGNIGFDFKHLGVILQFEMVVPKVAEYTSLSLTCEGKPFISCGTIDITSGEAPTINATEWCDEFEIALENFATTEPNQRVVVNLIMAPDDFSGKQIKVKLKGPHATFVTHFTRAEGKPYKPGTASRPELDNLEGGDVNMIEHGEQFNIAIKSLANGEDFILDKKDYLIKHIVFSAHSSGTPSLQYVDVSDQNSTSPIYAVWDPTASTMYIKSPDAHVFGGETIQYMFKNLVNLESIDFQDFSTEYTKSMMGTFYNCQELTSLNLSSWELSGIVEPYFAFEGCQKLTSITWPSGKTFPKDQDLWCGEMFKGCRSFTSIDLSCFDGCKISGANEMFKGCTNLVNIDMTDIDMSGCAEYDGMFMGCENLATLDLHNFGWSNTGGDRLTSAFNGCSSLESINLGNFNIQNVTRADNVFEGCSALRSLSYTSFSVNAESYRSFFKNCSSLTGIDVSGFVSSKAVDLYEMFDGCSSLESINVSAWNTSNVKDMTRLFAHCLKLSTINLENFKTFEVTTMCEMFGGCKNLKSLSLGSYFITEQLTDMSGMFMECEKITSLDFSKFKTSRVISFESMLQDCKALTTITWGDNFDTHYAENFRAMFAGCRSLKSLNLNFFNMSSATNIAIMFGSCFGLEDLDISSFTRGHTTGLGSIFAECKNMKELKLGKDFVFTVDELNNHDDASFTFRDFAAEVDNVTIYCSPEFMNNLHACFYYGGDDSYKAKTTWRNAETGEIMIPVSNQ